MEMIKIIPKNVLSWFTSTRTTAKLYKKDASYFCLSFFCCFSLQTVLSTLLNMHNFKPNLKVVILRSKRVE